MSSPQLHNQISARQHDDAIQPVHEQHEPSVSSNPPRRGAASRARRSALAVAIAAGIATGSAAILTSAGHTSKATAQSSARHTMQAPHVGATSVSFVRRFRELEAAGYVEVACQVDGALMFNPRFHRYEMVQA
jgi:hypothetical protein